MKKNVMMRVASALLVAVLMTTCAISGTFAKYTTSDTDTDTARVAKWGVNVAVEVDGAFASEYDADTTVQDAQAQTIAKTVVNTSGDNKNLLAPGTKGTLLKTATISGTPEVAVNVKKEATLVLTGWEVNGNYYCPIVITVGTTPVSGLDYNSADEFIAAVEALLDADTNYAPNTDLTYSVTVDWEWAFETGADADEKKANDILDTALGNLAADGSAPTISFTYTITVTQVN